MQRDILHRGDAGPVVAEADMLKLYIALQLQRLFGVGVGDALGVEHHADTPGGNLRVRQHDYHKRRHHDAVHRQCDILDYRKDVAAADAAQAVFHAPAAYPHDKHRRRKEALQRKADACPAAAF